MMAATTRQARRLERSNSAALCGAWFEDHEASGATTSTVSATSHQDSLVPLPNTDPYFLHKLTHVKPYPLDICRIVPLLRQ